MITAMSDFRFDTAVVHYHEIALKGENRPMFVRRLAENLRKSTADLGDVKVSVPHGRILLLFGETVEWEKIQKRIRSVFGVANFSPAVRCPSDPQAVEQHLDRILENRPVESFRISARRGDKRFPFSSMEMNVRLGRFVQEKTGARVDLDHPALNIHVEILPKEALVYFEKHSGPGGLPVGVSGHVMTLLSGGFDSPVASYLMMKRGCTMGFIHFHGAPFLGKASLEKTEELVDLLTRHQFRSTLHSVAFGEIQREIVLGVPPPLRVVIYRRFMVRIAEEIGRSERAKALVTGENLGQVASQTLDNMAVIQEAARLPILRPLVGFDKQEIIEWARSIGTFPISVQPDQDCCRLFIPPHPSVAARLDEVEKAERGLDVSGLVKAGLERTEKENFTFPG